MNWQLFARVYNVLGSNAGQIVQEFAQESGIDTIKLDGQCTYQPRSQIKKEADWWRDFCSFDSKTSND